MASADVAAAQKVPMKTRRSLGFSSVSKALADVMNKDAKDADKISRRTSKDTRRGSAIAMAASGARPSTADAPAPSPGAKQVSSPDSKTITRKRGSATVVKAPDGSPAISGPPRSASLRPRPVGGSNLPKYRPKSIIQDTQPGKKSPSPTSRKVKEDKESTSDDTDTAPPKVSPMRQKDTYKVDLPSATPPATPSRAGNATPTRNNTRQSSPTRKATRPAATAAAQSSSSSSSNSFLPRTPKSSQASSKSHQKSASNSSPTRNDSPLARHSRNPSKPDLASQSRRNLTRLASKNSDEYDSDEDEYEAENVAMLLAPVASPDAPTPAMPRITRQRLAPQTPTRPGLPSRGQLSYASPLPPDAEASPSLRIRTSPASGGAPRGSILSWEQFANEASKTLGEDEIDRMLSDVDAPFRAGAASPIPSVFVDIPPSPALSDIGTPGGGYGSISQVLLPDVTPSPAVHNRRPSRHIPPAESATANMLRLQMESAQQLAKERLIQLQKMEEENYDLKKARRHDAELLEAQVGTMETQLRSTLESREKIETEHATYIAVLEQQLSEALGARERMAGDHDKAQMQSAKLMSQRHRWDLLVTANETAAQWRSVHQQVDIEIELLDSNQEILTLLLAELEHTKAKLIAS
ncbi:hypothetical protein CYLTODRAFT_399716 [Cylindrobasidium torrendii FP15055 ss-10]|uniref:Uncharacterized protein n=1 Tax=Cylindrobasidium torrendii FP15055 ss-10 TaxID=1314674 RepID=A0A0D7B5S6_9AGAR|nr:hypothetical protein CYLTODRAFT_399716 [Cylindrobasidium torrendii FP15055 ss-10]